MAREQTNIFWKVILAAGGICLVIVAGWFVTTRYLGQQDTTVATVATEPEAAVHTPRHRAPRASQSANGKGGQEASDASSAQGAGALGADDEGAGERHGAGESANAAGRGPDAPATTEDEARAHDENALPAAAPQIAEAPRGAVDENALAIVQEAQRRTESKSHQYEGLLQMFDAAKKISEKRWTFERLGSHGLSKELLRFTAPAEVKGVALLIVNHPDRASDQWMWTPAIERDRRIAMQDRSTRFFGTDFSFEDLEEHDVDQYDYSMLGSETIDGVACWKIQWTPKQTRSSQYTRSIGWIRKDNYALARFDNYVKDDVVKRLNYSNIENVQGIWTARQLEMNDLRRGSRTRLTLEQVSYGIPVKEENFTLQALRHQ